MEIKDLLERLDFQGDIENLTPEAFEEHVQKTFVARKLAASDPDIVKSVTGNRFGAFSTLQKRQFKELGIELNDDEIKDKKEEEIFQLGAQKIKEKLTALEEASKGSSDEKVKGYVTKAQELEQKWKEENLLRTNLAKQMEEKEAEWGNKFKTIKLDTKLSEIKKRVPFSDEAAKDEIKLAGFDFVLGQKYAFDIDENDEPVVKDKKTGERIRNEKNTDFETVENILLREAKAANMLKLNNSTGGANAQQTQFQSRQTTNNGSGNKIAEQLPV